MACAEYLEAMLKGQNPDQDLLQNESAIQEMQLSIMI
jgi:hypothetical protein